MKKSPRVNKQKDSGYGAGLMVGLVLGSTGHYLGKTPQGRSLYRKLVSGFEDFTRDGGLDSLRIPGTRTSLNLVGGSKPVPVEPVGLVEEPEVTEIEQAKSALDKLKERFARLTAGGLSSSIDKKREAEKRFFKSGKKLG